MVGIYFGNWKRAWGLWVVDIVAIYGGNGEILLKKITIRVSKLKVKKLNCKFSNLLKYQTIMFKMLMRDQQISYSFFYFSKFLHSENY